MYKNLDNSNSCTWNNPLNKIHVVFFSPFIAWSKSLQADDVLVSVFMSRLHIMMVLIQAIFYQNFAWHVTKR